MLQGKQVKRSRYIHQVSCAALYLLLCDAYVDSERQAETFYHWIEDRHESSAQFHYWITVIEMEVLLLKLVRSLRESNFQMFVNALDEITPWMFALDHTHYARWLPIFIQDLKMLETKTQISSVSFKKAVLPIKRLTDHSPVWLKIKHTSKIIRM